MPGISSAAGLCKLCKAFSCAKQCVEFVERIEIFAHKQSIKIFSFHFREAMITTDASLHCLHRDSKGG